MDKKFKLFQTVVLNSNEYKQYDVKKGDIGTILDIYMDGHYEVEFCDENGATKLMQAFSETELLCKEKNN